MATQRDCFAALGDMERAADTSMRIARTHADDQDLKRALDACRQGLEVSRESIPLRFQYAQLLARTDNVTVAQGELRDIIELARDSKKGTPRTRRARELLIACNTLLLRLDPQDEDAQTGLRELESQSSDRRRRRQLAVRVGIASATLILLLGLGISLMPPSATDIMEIAMEKRTAGDMAGMQELLQKISIEFPDSPEATEAAGILKSLNSGAEDKAREQREKKQAAVREEFKGLQDQLQKQLTEGDLGEAATELAFFLKRLGEREAAFLRADVLTTIKFEVSQFMDRALRVFAEDRSFVSTCERQLTQGAGELLKDIADTEKRLADVRGRNWPALSKQLSEKLQQALATGMLKGSEKEIGKFRKAITTAGQSISGLDALYYRVRSRHLKEQILDAVKDARSEGRTLLGKCEFQSALRYFRAAYDKADAVAHEQPRKYFKDLNNWISDRGFLEDLDRDIRGIEEVVRSLREVDTLMASEREDAAFRLLRDLVREHRLVQFERRYKMPYRVTSEPSGARVLVNGKPVGETPCAVEFELASGIDVRVESPGFRPVQARLEITNPDLDGRLAVTLQKIGLWEQPLRGAPEARPVIHGDLVLVPTNEASLLALRADTGERAWEAETGLLDRLKVTPLAAAGHAIFVTAGGQLTRVRLSDGERVGELKLPGEVHQDGVMADGVAYFATRNRKLVAVRGDKIVYVRDLASVPVTSLVSVGKRLVVGTTDGELLVHDRRTGKFVRRLSSPERSSFFGGICVFGDLVVAAAEDGHLHAFRTSSKERLWRYRMAGPLAAAPCSDGEHLYLPMRNGFLQRLDAEGGNPDRLDFRNSMACSPVFSNGFIYVAAGARLAAYDNEGSQAWWEVGYEDEMPQHIAAGEKVIVAVTNRGRVLAYPADSR